MRGGDRGRGTDRPHIGISGVNVTAAVVRTCHALVRVGHLVVWSGHFGDYERILTLVLFLVERSLQVLVRTR